MFLYNRFLNCLSFFFTHCDSLNDQGSDACHQRNYFLFLKGFLQSEPIINFFKIYSLINFTVIRIECNQISSSTYIRLILKVRSYYST